MNGITHAEALKKIRAIAKRNGLVFKRQPRMTINGASAYMFVNRESGQRIIENCRFWTAYQDCMSGYIDTRKQ